MDEHKNLKPELKEVYERVMNTPTNVTKSAQTPSVTSEKSQTPQSSPAPTPVQNNSGGEDFLTSTPPRQISSASKGFVFSSKNQDEKEAQEKQEEATHQTTHSSHKSFITGKMIVLGVIFLVIWTFFWLVLLGVIQPGSIGL